MFRPLPFHSFRWLVYLPCFVALPIMPLARSPVSFLRWGQLLIFLSVLFLGVGLALFYDRLRSWIAISDAGVLEA